MCAQCGDHQFERNMSCRKCGAAKPAGGAMMGGMGGGCMGGMGGCMRGMGMGMGGCGGLGGMVGMAGGRGCMGGGMGCVGGGMGGVMKRPDDWVCPQCGDLQFARNAQCRKCGGDKPAVATNKVVQKAGDWICPNPECQDVQFERNQNCRKCGMPKPGTDGEMAEPVVPEPMNNTGVNDWNCPQCGDLQFGRNPGCRKCGAPRPGGTSKSTNGVVAKEGDWFCPGCKDLQFERNSSCRKCGTPKPRGALRAVAGAAGVMANVSCSNADGSKTVNARPGDWFCPNRQCGDLQFERNMSCRRCGTPKPGMMGGMMGGGMMGGGMVGGGCGRGMGMGMLGMGMGGCNANMRPGDWICSSCQDVQFAKNEVCRKCGSPKPQVASNSQAFKPGDWICPNPACQDVVFAKHDACRKCGTQKPEVDHSRSPRGGAMAGTTMWS